MADRILEKMIVTLVFFIILVIILSIPIGIFLAKLISKTYINIFKNLTDAAQERLKLDKNITIGDNERIILEKYISVLISDQAKLLDYEKVKSWKDGARLLMHELKNPLTPLKLAVQSLLINDTDSSQKNDHVAAISTSLNDMESIIQKFKEFVNIEFGKKEEFDLLPLMDEILFQVYQSGNDLKIEKNIFSKTIIILSEKILLKMLFINLINNGMEANPKEFYISAEEKQDAVWINFITPNKKIKDPRQIYRLGYSEKGKQRGFGLFLCKQISDYLDLNIQYENKNNSVIFDICIKKI
jgi:two-component system nitrogen regulation sensor histidine kinase NtrY